MKLNGRGFITELLPLPQPILQQDFTVPQNTMVLTKEGLGSSKGCKALSF